MGSRRDLFQFVRSGGYIRQGRVNVSFLQRGQGLYAPEGWCAQLEDDSAEGARQGHDCYFQVGVLLLPVALSECSSRGLNSALIVIIRSRVGDLS